MKRTALTLLFLASVVTTGFAQQPVRMNPTLHNWIDISSGNFKVGGNVGQEAGAGDTTLAFSAKYWQGVAAIFAKISDGSDADTCMTVYIQLKNNRTGWAAAGGNSDWQKAKIDTVNRDFNANDGAFYLDIGGTALEKWTVADSARFIFQMRGSGPGGETDSLTISRLQVVGH